MITTIEQKEIIFNLFDGKTLRMLYNNIPSSYTLPTDDDFVVTWSDYTNKLAAGLTE
jgi:hypothetical protein